MASYAMHWPLFRTLGLDHGPSEGYEQLPLFQGGMIALLYLLTVLLKVVWPKYSRNSKQNRLANKEPENIILIDFKFRSRS